MFLWLSYNMSVGGKKNNPSFNTIFPFTLWLTWEWVFVYFCNLLSSNHLSSIHWWFFTIIFQTCQLIPYRNFLSVSQHIKSKIKTAGIRRQTILPCVFSSVTKYAYIVLLWNTSVAGEGQDLEKWWHGRDISFLHAHQPE